ncbi:hypothetical protein NDU88_003530 [Pleurodeles waltl]|uniref:Uncharacterized protein n=1 Tax=Pleurodeles waltl TaxID=8319 RepID=A0AAV7KV71_PLEWA|nr:hypothetical protein NDU88_003530 [Pleurodeles waltl]
MAGYDDQAEELYYMDDTAGAFDQDLVYALDAGVRHSVNQALAQAIQPIKHHLLGLVDQQAWAAPVSASSRGDPSFAANPQPEKQLSNLHAADFQSLIRNMAREHDYNAGSQKKGVDVPASSSSSSEPSSEQEDTPPHKRKKKAHHQEVPTPKVLTFEPVGMYKETAITTLVTGGPAVTRVDLPPPLFWTAGMGARGSQSDNGGNPALLKRKLFTELQAKIVSTSVRSSRIEFHTNKIN